MIKHGLFRSGDTRFSQFASAGVVLSTSNRSGREAHTKSLGKFRPSDSQTMKIKEAPAGPAPKTRRTPSVHQIELRSGGLAFVDKEDAKKIEGYRWTWMKGKGAAAFFKKRTVLLHNLIAPYPQVSFKNGNKLDCRKENLVDAKDWPQVKRKSATGNVSASSRHSFFIVHRSVVEAGVRYAWNTKVNFKMARTREEAYEIAQAKARWIHSLSREEFIQFVQEGRRKRRKQKRPDHS